MPKSFRRKPSADDAADAEPSAASAAPPPPKPKAKKPAVTMSFDMDDEGEAFKVKKSKARAAHKLKRGDAEAAAAVDTLVSSGGAYSAEALQKLRAQSLAPGAAAAAAAVESGDASALESVPDAEAVRAARAARERARRAAEEGHGTALAGPAGAAYIPLDGGGGGGGGGRESGLVREEDELEAPSVFDDQNGSRLRFGPSFGAGEARRASGGAAAAAAAGAIETVVQDGDEADAMDEDDAMATGGGGGGAAAASASGEALAEYFERVCRPSHADGLREALALRVTRLEEAAADGRREAAQTERLLGESASECGALEEGLASGLAAHDFLRRAQAYVSDLLDCLGEKAPLVEECEGALCDAIELHHAEARRAAEAAMAAERARAAAALGGAWAPPPVRVLPLPEHVEPPPFGDGAGAAELGAREAARRRRRAAANGSAAAAAAAWPETSGDDGDGDDDDDDGTDAAGGEGGSRGARFGAAVRLVLAEASEAFADVAPEFASVRAVRERFSEWRRAAPDAYAKVFLDECLPTLLAPLVRLELLEWRPLREGSVEALEWHRELRAPEAGPAAAGDGGAAAAAAAAAAATTLAAQLATKLALPRLKHAVGHSWDVLSRAQGAQLRTGARELSAAAAHLVREAQRAADAGEESAADAQAAASAAAAAAREVLMQVAVRLEAAVGDACVPPIALAAGDAAAEAAERQLWRALKLVELVGAWRDQLADGALRELAAALLAQHALPYLRAQLAAAPPRWELVVGGVEAAARALPDAWRKGGGGGGRTASCAALLGRFVADELAPAVAAAGGGAPEGCRRACCCALA